MKKFFISILMVLGVVMVAGCSGNSSDKAKGDIKISVEKSKYEILQMRNKKYNYLALKVVLKNNSNVSEDTSVYGFTLKNSAGKKMKLDDFETTDNQFDEDTVAQGESMRGYLYFRIDKLEPDTYTLEYDSDNGTKVKSVKINTKKNTDNSQEAVTAMNAIVNEVLLGKNDANYNKMVNIDRKKIDKEINKKAKEKFNEFGKSTLPIKNYDISKEVTKEVQLKNQKDSSVEYKVLKYTGDYALLSIKVKAVNFDAMDTNEDQQTAAEQQLPVAGKMYTEKDINEALAQKIEQATIDVLKKDIANSPIKQSKSVEVYLQKEDGKWVLTPKNYINDEYEDDDTFKDELVPLFLGDVTDHM